MNEYDRKYISAHAGMAGMSHAMESLMNAHSMPLLHLANMNPYVTAAMGSPSQEQIWSVARQTSSAARLAASGSVSVACGVSAFAFQVSRCVQQK